MAPHILTIPDVAKQLPELFKEAKRADHPLWLTVEKDAEPVAVVMEVDEYEEVQKRTYRLYHWQLLHLRQWLDRVERFWDNEQLRAECVQTWQENSWLLWEVAPKAVREFVAGLTLSAKRMDSKTLSKEQIIALRYALDSIEGAAPNIATIEEAYQRLIESGLPPMLSLDDELVQLYLDEL